MAKDKEKIEVDILEDEPVEETKMKKESPIDLLTKENEELKEKVKELNNKYLLCLAEQKNFKKRMDDEMDRFYKYSTFDFSKDLIQFLDSFDISIAKVPDNEEAKKYLEGFKMMRNQLGTILEKQGISEIEALGKEFDPNLMNAIGKKTEDGKKDQEVLQVFMKGYMYKDRVLRAAHVIINEEAQENK